MTFRLLNALSEFFKNHPTKKICLRDYGDDGWYTIYSFNINDDIKNVANNIRKFPTAELFVFDGDVYTEFPYLGV